MQLLGSLATPPVMDDGRSRFAQRMTTVRPPVGDAATFYLGHSGAVAQTAECHVAAWLNRAFGF